MDYDPDSDPGYGPGRHGPGVPWKEYRVVAEASRLPRVSYESAGYGMQHPTPRQQANTLQERARLNWLAEEPEQSCAGQQTLLQQSNSPAYYGPGLPNCDDDRLGEELGVMPTRRYQSPPYRTNSTKNSDTPSPREDKANSSPSHDRSTSRQEPPRLPISHPMPAQRLILFHADGSPIQPKHKLDPPRTTSLRSRNANNALLKLKQLPEPPQGLEASVSDVGGGRPDSKEGVPAGHGKRSAEAASKKPDWHYDVSLRPKPLAANVEDASGSGHEDGAFRAPAPTTITVKRPASQPARPQTPLSAPSEPISSTTGTDARDTAVQFHNNGEVTNQVGSNQNVSGSLYFGTVVNNTYHVDSKHEEKPVQALRDSGTSLNAQGGRFGTPLQEASFFGEDSIVRALIDAGADVNAPGGSVGTALQAAALQGYSKIVLALLRAGADVDAQSGEYCTALQAAAGSDREPAGLSLVMLLAAGADVDVVGGKYGTALQAAVCLGREKAVSLLLSSKANVNARGGVHGTALRAAMSRRNNGKVIQMLLDAGADANA